MYLAIDLETTGLNPDFDCILEIAAVILDELLEEVSPWCVVRIARPSAMLERMPDVVKEMHTKTGLIANRDGVWWVVDGVSPQHAAKELLRLVESWGMNQAPEIKLELLGCGVHFDAKFLAKFVELPRLSHRIFDSRTAKSIAHLRTDVFGARTAEMEEHTAKGDVLRSIADLKLARRIFANGIRAMEEDCTAPWLGKMCGPPRSVEVTIKGSPAVPVSGVIRYQVPSDPEMKDRIARELFGDDVVDASKPPIVCRDESGNDISEHFDAVHSGTSPSDHEVLPDAPSEDTADAYTAAVEAGDPSTPVALADATIPDWGNVQKADATRPAYEGDRDADPGERPDPEEKPSDEALDWKYDPQN